MREAEVTEVPVSTPSVVGDRVRRISALLRRHLAIVLLVGAATALRAVALVAVYPGIWFSDTNEFLKTATTGQISIVRVQGYALFLAPFLHLGSTATLLVIPA